MSRINRTIKGTSYSTPEPEDFDEDGRDMDTADRLRESRERMPDRKLREAEMDGRNQPRAEVADYEWRRPTSLEAPPARAGYKQRWVRAEMRNENDNLNWTGKMREGWRPRDPATVPDCESFYNVGQHATSNVIRVGGMILMEIEEHKLAAKRKAIRAATRNQEESIAMETTKVSNEGVRSGFSPINREEKVVSTTGRGRSPATLAD